jgi:hypothetical protein
VLFERQPSYDLHEVPSPDLSPSLYTALAYLIRIAVRRALLARLEEGHIDRAYRERAFAASLCQQVLIRSPIFLPSRRSSRKP